MSDTKTSPQPADAAEGPDTAEGPDAGRLDDAERLSSAPEENDAAPVGIGVLGWLRWFWRQLTSMRVALLLLFLLSLAAIPGSLVPQNTNAFKVAEWKNAHKGITPLYEKLQLFDVYSSVWFSAIYILLFVSLAGCILPRTWQFVGVLRAQPPAAPRNLTRMPVYAAWHTGAAPEQVEAAAHRLLKKRRFRVAAGPGPVAAEKGYLREVGNLLFHFALFALLTGFAWASLDSGSGTKIVLEGQGYSNTTTQLDDFTGSRFYGVDDLDAFGFKLDGFTADFQTSGPAAGTAKEFVANVRYWEGSDSGRQKNARIEVNHPLEVGGSKVFLTAHGFAPVVTVRNAQNEVVYRGPTVFLPRDSNVTSFGAIKVNDYGTGPDGQKTQMAFQGFFLPTAASDFTHTGPISVFPAAANPQLVISAYVGDLRTDSGLPQNVYELDDKALTQLQVDGKPAAVKLKVGEGWDLPDGYGSITFDGYQQWANFTVSHRPGNAIALLGAVAAILGLIGSLFVQRRRIWVRAVAAPDGRTLVEVAGLGRSDSARTAEELAELAVELQDDAPATDAPATDAPPGPDAPATDAPAAADSPAAAVPTAPETKE
ncbi:cytochrome c biogenesis protein ResB [Kitasatospora sp. NA04385]|uniref:cytochrome c biogenesis protein ResB n=1 Tax=Kitasatospora sp. NA04385 TaxID=2742135 RepID=UPI0015920B19|nr:cytochrome c biogenesis protein ResB [Kitasatospora sp. NA04385]QKW20072.1 cytochrome c biogenesis protein ResB [Kitasatospora sp. NA04385]